MALNTDPETLVAVVIMFGSAVLIAFLGVRIRRGETSLIAGYTQNSVADEGAIARLVGTTAVVLGVVTVLFAVALIVVEPHLWFRGSYVGIFVAALVIVQIRGRQYAA